MERKGVSKEKGRKAIKGKEERKERGVIKKKRQKKIIKI